MIPTVGAPRIDQLVPGGATAARDQLSGILPTGHLNHPEPGAIGAGEQQAADRCRLTGGIGIEDQGDLWHTRAQNGEMLGGEGGTGGGHHMFDPRIPERDRIEVPLHHDRLAGTLDRGEIGEPEERLALAKERGLR